MLKSGGVVGFEGKRVLGAGGLFLEEELVGE